MPLLAHSGECTSGSMEVHTTELVTEPVLAFEKMTFRDLT